MAGSHWNTPKIVAPHLACCRASFRFWPQPRFAVLAVLVLLLYTPGKPALWQTIAIGVIAGGPEQPCRPCQTWTRVDFLSVGPWPNFNVADSAITIRVLVLIWSWTRPITVLACLGRSIRELMDCGLH